MIIIIIIFNNSKRIFTQVYDQMHIQKMRHIKNISYTYYQWLHQAPVVQTLDSAIHRINHYPADKCYGNQLRYPLHGY